MRKGQNRISGLFVSIVAVVAIGCQGRGSQVEIGRLTKAGNVTRLHISSKMAPELEAKYLELPPVSAEKRGRKWRCWLTLDDWRTGRSEWLPGTAFAYYGRCPYLIEGIEYRVESDAAPRKGGGNSLIIGNESVAQALEVSAQSMTVFGFEDEPERERAVRIRGRVDEDMVLDELQFFDHFRARPLKLIWPRQIQAQLERGDYGSIGVHDLQAEWHKEGADGDLLTLEVTLILNNVTAEESRLSAEVYLTGDDRVLIERLRGTTTTTVYTPTPGHWDYMLVDPNSGSRRFSPMSSFYYCSLESGEARTLSLKTEKMSRMDLERFGVLEVRGLAHGWRFPVPKMP